MKYAFQICSDGTCQQIPVNYFKFYNEYQRRKTIFPCHLDIIIKLGIIM